MSNITKKDAIQKSLDRLNASEKEQVLNYISGLVSKKADQSIRFKKQAMKQIQQALKSNPLHALA